MAPLHSIANTLGSFEGSIVLRYLGRSLVALQAGEVAFENRAAELALGVANTRALEVEPLDIVAISEGGTG